MEWLQNEVQVQHSIERYDIVDMLNNSDGLVEIPDFFPLSVAEAIHTELLSLHEDRWSVREDNDNEVQNTTQHHFLVASPNDIKNDLLTLAIRVVQMLLPEKRSVFSAGKYLAGDHITEHDDHALVMHQDPADKEPVLCSRDVAVICYLSKEWKPEYGGLLVDTATEKVYVPTFNKLIAFMVPRFHEVTAVTSNIPRLSLFGWFLVEGDIYHYVEDAKQRKKKKRRKTKT